MGYYIYINKDRIYTILTPNLSNSLTRFQYNSVTYRFDLKFGVVSIEIWTRTSMVLSLNITV